MALTLQQARKVIEACKAQALARGLKQAIVVVDSAGNVVSMDRLDGTNMLREEFARAKAFTSVMFRRPSGEMANMMNANPSLFHGVSNLLQGRVFLVGGALPIVEGGELLGAVGVSGGTAQEDEEIARAGLEALNRP